jgi:ATP-dependent exoDNAse (exonuclease V) alpha subunit
MYHFSAQVISRSSGRTATAAAAYRAGEEVTDHRTGEVHDYTRKGGVVGAGILAPADAPAWVLDREKLWNQVEASERRKDAQLCREIDAAIPIELNEHQRIDAVRTFVEQEMVSRGMVADVAFHDFDSGNPHCHIMLTMRHLEPDGFGAKNRDWNDRSVLQGWREKWADHMNKALELAGEEKRIDHRSYVDQGLNLEPTWHMGPAVAAMERRRPGSTRVGQANLLIEYENEKREHEETLVEVDEYYVEQLEVANQLIKIEITKAAAEVSRAAAAREAARAAQQASDAAAMLTAMKAQKAAQGSPEAVETAPEKPLTQLQKDQAAWDAKHGRQIDDLDDWDDLDDGPTMG